MDFISQLCALGTKPEDFSHHLLSWIDEGWLSGHRPPPLFFSGLCRGGSQGVGRESHNVGHVRGFWSDTEEVSHAAEKLKKSAFIISNHCGTLSKCLQYCTAKWSFGRWVKEKLYLFLPSSLPPSLHLFSPFPPSPFLPFLSFFKPEYKWKL